MDSTLTGDPPVATASSPALPGVDPLSEALISAFDGFAILLSAGRTILRVSPAAQKLFGWTSPALEGLTVEMTNSLHMDRGVRKSYLESILEKHEPWEGAWLKVNRNAEEFLVRMRAIPLLAGSGLTGILEVFTVPSATMATEDELALESLLNEKLLQLVPSPVAIMNEAGRIGYISQSFESFACQPKDKLLGLELKSFLSENFDQELFLDTLSREGVIPGWEVRWAFPGPNRDHELKLKAELIHVPTFRFRAIVAVMEDLTPLRRQRQESELFEAAFERNPEALVITRDTGEIDRVNREARKILGKDEDDLRDQPITGVPGVTGRSTALRVPGRHGGEVLWTLAQEQKLEPERAPEPAAGLRRSPRPARSTRRKRTRRS